LWSLDLELLASSVAPFAKLLSAHRGFFPNRRESALHHSKMPNRRSSRTPQKAAESASEELKRRPTFVPDQELPGGRTSPNTTITSKKKVKRDEMESETESGTESEEDEEEEEEVRSPSRRRRRRRRSETETETESEEEKEEAARSTSSSSLRSRRSGRTRNSSRPRSMSPSPEKKKSKPRKKGGSKSLIADLTSSAIYLLFAAVAVVIIARGGAFEDHDKDGDRDFHDAKATLVSILP
jgi:hypothetical protein